MLTEVMPFYSLARPRIDAGFFETVYGENGQFLTGSFTDYALPAPRTQCCFKSTATRCRRRPIPWAPRAAGKRVAPAHYPL
jgi:hypothetical protein